MKTYDVIERLEVLTKLLDAIDDIAFYDPSFFNKHNILSQYKDKYLSEGRYIIEQYGVLNGRCETKEEIQKELYQQC